MSDNLRDVGEHERMVDDLRRSVAFVRRRCVVVLVVRAVVRDVSIALVLRIVVEEDDIAHGDGGEAFARRIRGRVFEFRNGWPCLRQLVLHDLVVRLEAGEKGPQDVVHGALEEKGSMREPSAQPLVHLDGQRLPSTRVQTSGAGVVVEVVFDVRRRVRTVRSKMADGVVHEDVEKGLELVRDLNGF